MKHLRPLSLGVPLLLLVSCGSTPQVTDDTDLDGPVRGPADVTTFVAGADGGPVGVKSLATLAKTIRKYKNLGAGEQEILRRVAQLKLDGLVAGEMRRLAPKFEQRKKAIRQRTQARIVEIDREVKTARKPPAVAKVEKEKVAAREVREVAQVDLEWKSAAQAEVTKNYGTDFAVPVSNPEGRAVVAFASVKESGISISSAAYELAGTDTQLTAAASSGSQKVTHEGASYAVLDATAKIE